MEFATYSAVAVADFPVTGRGVAVSRDVEEGEVLLEVPLEHCWTAENAARALKVRLEKKEAILLHLMVEAAKETSASAARSASSHLQSLPTLESMGLPNFWGEELDELEGSEVHTHAMRLKEELPEDFQRLQQKLQSAGPAGAQLAAAAGVDFLSYQWAWSIYSSRVMSFTVGDKADALFAIVPGLDMFNHSPSVCPGLFKLDAERRMVVVKAGSRLVQGDQAFINYSDAMFNSQMLLSFGFLLPDEALQSAEITLSLQVSSEKLAVHSRLLDACSGGSQSSQFQVLHRPPKDFEGVRELIVRHALTLSNPLPQAFLGMVRAQHLPLGADPGAAAGCLSGLGAKDEMRALLLVSLLLDSKDFRGDEAADRRELEEGPEEGPGEGRPARRRLALLQRTGERRVLQRAAAEAERLQRACLRESLLALSSASGKCDCQECQRAHTPWLHKLRAASSRLAAEVSSVASLSKGLAGRLPSLQLQQACHLFNLWVVGGLEAGAPRLRLAPETWPLGACAAGAAGAAGSEQALEQALEQAEQGDGNEYLAIYAQKMRLWGSWLASQWMHCGAIQVEELSSMGHEQLALRKKYAWSVPTPEALQAVAARQPLLEIGAGTAYWAALLRQRDVDILTFDCEHFDSKFNAGTDIPEGKQMRTETHCKVLPGGPDMVQKHPDRTLVLMWPDYMGLGTYGLECLQSYRGKELILVGEWRNSTFGSYTEDVSAHGQSFALALQEMVEKEFCLVETVALPNWPLFLDCLQVFRRRQGPQGPQGEGYSSPPAPPA